MTEETRAGRQGASAPPRGDRRALARRADVGCGLLACALASSLACADASRPEPAPQEVAAPPRGGGLVPVQVETVMTLISTQVMPDQSLRLLLTLRPTAPVTVRVIGRPGDEPLRIEHAALEVLGLGDEWRAPEVPCVERGAKVELSPGTDYLVQVTGTPRVEHERPALVRVRVSPGLVSDAFEYDRAALQRAGAHERAYARASQALATSLRTRGLTGPITRDPDPARALAERLTRLGEAARPGVNCGSYSDARLAYELTRFELGGRLELELLGSCAPWTMNATLWLTPAALEPEAVRAATVEVERYEHSVSASVDSLEGSYVSLTLGVKRARGERSSPDERPPLPSDAEARRVARALERDVLAFLEPRGP
ncbi:MAG: hypothetical protein H6713_12460 [Myxococcales bacterium]|nr:hypothetical protein [Myxococcales bacterium]